MDDPLQAALSEAEAFMNELTMMGTSVETGFSIDSDEEGEEVPLNEETASNNSKSGVNTSTTSGPDDPLSLAAAESSAAAATSFHPLQDNATSAPAPAPSSAPLPALSMAHSSAPNTNMSQAAHPHATAQSTADAIKQQTSRFASNFVHMAQRAATQMQSIGVPSPTAAGTHNISAYPAPHNGYPAAAHQANQTPPPPVRQSSAPTPSLDKEQQAALIQTHVGDLLPGEKVIMFLSNLLHVSDSTGFSYSHNATTQWCAAMTYYRLLLFGTHPSRPPTKPADWHTDCWPTNTVHLLEVPLASMEKVEKSVFTAPTVANGYPAATTTTTTLMGVLIQGKDNRLLRFTTAQYAETLRAYEALQTYAFPGRRNIGYLFAFESKKEAVMRSIENNRVTLPPVPRRFDGLVEYQRQLDRRQQDNVRPWTIYANINAQYQLSPTYPSVLAGPASLDEANPESVRILQQSAAFRSEQRLPSLTWASGVDGASLWRSSQPKIGLQGNRSAADELLIKHIQEQAAAANAMVNHAFKISLPASVVAQFTGVSPYNPTDVAAWASPNCELKILDLRPRASAMANRTGGYGYENTSNYPGTTLQFCNIGNIHAVRDAYQKMSALCLAPSTQDLQWVSLMEDTKWLSAIRIILAASWETAFWIHVHRLPVLLHCSHGWDRTSQVAVIAQLLLDPYYRTCKGFACLVEKDFMGFGHPFHTRCAHGEGRSQDSNTATPTPNHDESQVSPIFVQFLDAVFQVVNQFPQAFEFNTKYLLTISDHLYSCRFGNFLCDTERERELAAGLRQRTHSLWDYLDETAEEQGLLNETFVAADNQGALLMPLPSLLRNVTLWTERHARYGRSFVTE